MKENKESYFKRKRHEAQINKIEKIVEKTGKLIPAFQEAYKLGDINIFIEFINDNKLEETFLEYAFDDSFKIGKEEKDERDCFYNIIEQIGFPYFRKIYGEELYKKMMQLSEKGKFTYFDICQLAMINKPEDIRPQANIIEQIFDLYNEENVTIGIHRTGGWHNAGKTINEKGLELTGHISSGVDSRDYEDIRDKLEENISFEHSPGFLIRQIATGGHYKNFLQERFVDISLIVIPDEEFKKKNQQIILQGETNGFYQPILNAKFVKGYITVDNENSTLKQYIENPKYINQVRTNIPENKKEENDISPWIERLNKWTEESKQPRFFRIRQRISSIFHELTSKGKEKSAKLSPYNEQKKKDNSLDR